MGKGRSRRNRHMGKGPRQHSGGVACLPPPHPDGQARSFSQQPSRSGVPLSQGLEPLVEACLNRQARRIADREERKGQVEPGPIGAADLCGGADADLAPLPANRSLAVPRAAWIETVRDWVGMLSTGIRRALAERRAAMPVRPADRGQLERLRRDLDQAQRTLDGVLAGLARDRRGR